MADQYCCYFISLDSREKMTKYWVQPEEGDDWLVYPELQDRWSDVVKFGLDLVEFYRIDGVFKRPDFATVPLSDLVHLDRKWTMGPV